MTPNSSYATNAFLKKIVVANYNTQAFMLFWYLMLTATEVLSLVFSFILFGGYLLFIA